MAKGMEDTTFYIYARLVSLNEVGGDPRAFGVSCAAFHLANRERHQHWPHNLLATSTHDSKRAEDVRTRIDVLSELPEEWRAKAMLWHRFNRGKKQRLAGRAGARSQRRVSAVPDAGGRMAARGSGRGGHGSIPRSYPRIHAESDSRGEGAHLVGQPQRALRAGGRRVRRRVVRLPSRSAFLQELLPFQRKVARLGMYNSLSQVLLKLTVPGVPDVYQGTELWSFDLVDPDNRREVDYALRARLLDEIARSAELDASSLRGFVQSLLESMPDGRIKLYFTLQAACGCVRSSMRCSDSVTTCRCA